MSLDAKCKELKTLISQFDTQWMLGNLAALMHAGQERAKDQLGKLSSPMRQIYYLAGLLVTSDPAGAINTHYSDEDWKCIVRLLNEIEVEYEKIFFPKDGETITEEWKQARKVAMPSFLAYFNQGPLNYEEQTINWIKELFIPVNDIIEKVTDVKVQEYIEFYNNIDQLVHKNFQAFTTKPVLLRPNWKSYTKVKLECTAPQFLIDALPPEYMITPFYMADQGIVHRFFPDELSSTTLPEERVRKILQQLSCNRTAADFLYYTATRPGNPLLERPIVALENDMYQVFEVKQVIHAIQNYLEAIANQNVPKYINKKGKILENKVVHLFKRFLGDTAEIYTGYFVDGCEQDILILWKKFAFIIEGKGYALREPLRDPGRAFVRIKDDFNNSIGYGYEQTRRVEIKFINNEPLRITEANGKIIKEIDTNAYEHDFSIIVNTTSFGQIQVDLSTLLKIESDEDVYPWAVRFDDLETFLLTMIAKRIKPEKFVEFLLMREQMQGKVICSDELQICGGFLTGHISERVVNKTDTIVTMPDLANIFDAQYHKGMGFKDEKLIKEKESGKYIFW